MAKTTLDLQAIKSLFNNATAMTVKLDDVELYDECQQRLKPNTEGIESYQEAMEAGEAPNFPPIRLVKLAKAEKLPDGTELEAGALVLSDGFTRHTAAEKAGLEEFQAEYVEGTLEDAKQFSWVANAQHGSKLGQNDYQALIRKIYLQDPKVKKGDLARSLGCAAKTVSKALGVVEEEFKAKAHTMFTGGFSDKEIAKEVHKTEQTVKNWREAWNEEQNTPPEPPKPVNPMKMKFDEVLAMEDLDKQINLLEMLQARVDENKRKANPDAPIEAPLEAANEPLEGELVQPTTEAVEAPQGAIEEQGELDIPFEVEAEPVDCWSILGREREQVAGLANPKASLTRTVRTLIKEGKHTEEVIKQAEANALAELAE